MPMQHLPVKLSHQTSQASTASAPKERDTQVLCRGRTTDPLWNTAAYEFLLKYALAHELFVIYDVGDASRRAGLAQPRAQRDWGEVHRRARKAGVISLDGIGPSTTQPDLIGPRWRSQTFALPEQKSGEK